MCTAGKRMKFATTPVWHYPPHLRHIATLPWEILKKSNFLQIFSDNTRYGIITEMQNANKLHCKCTDFNSSTRVTVHAECIYAFYQHLVLVAEYHVDHDKHCSDVCCDEFPVPQIDLKSKQVQEQWHGKFYLQSVRGKTRYIKHRKY